MKTTESLETSPPSARPGLRAGLRIWGARPGWAIAVLCGLLGSVRTHAASPSPSEMAESQSRSRAWFGEQAAAPPFSFTYDGVASAEFLARWTFRRSLRPVEGLGTEITLVWSDPKQGLVLRSVAVQYADFPVLDWTIYFENSGTGRSAILENIQAMDARFERGDGAEFTLHHAKGSPADPTSFEPRTTLLNPGQKLPLATSGGRSSNATMPYWNLAWGDRGLMCAVGWPGQWAAEFHRETPKGLRLRAGQEQTHFYLEPGERVRGPRMAVLFWQGDRLRGHNLWRSWMLAHNTPRPGGKLPPTQLVACSSHQFNEMQDANEENQKLFIDRYVEEKLPIRYWWMDAGWYVHQGTWVNTGTWQVDSNRFPHGLRAITDHGRSKGVKSIVWFEPERVTTNSWIFENHPEWCLAATQLPAPIAYQGQWRLFNLGNPEAWTWMVNHIDGLITSQGVDLYRQDFNMDPLQFWRAQDPPDRQGITEIRYVTGYLAYWDELRRRHPDMLIDSCASGGRRNDIETMRRAVPLVRDDHLFEPVGQQAHFHGISFWLPFHGTGTLVGPSKIFNLPPGKVDVNLFRSHMSPSVTACWDVRRQDLDYGVLRQLSQQLLKIQPLQLGDYYPLTGYSLARDVWMAWQFDRSDLGEGLLQVFRREDSVYETARFKLRGLSSNGRYSLTDLDHPEAAETVSGEELMSRGFAVTVAAQPAAVVYVYKKLN